MCLSTSCKIRKKIYEDNFSIIPSYTAKNYTAQSSLGERNPWLHRSPDNLHGANMWGYFFTPLLSSLALSSDVHIAPDSLIPQLARAR
jgi:hypothetical protein